jgi:phage recombination protein Bet
MGRPPGAKNKTTTKPVADQAMDEPTSKGELAVFSPPRLPYDHRIEDKFGIDLGQWKVLTEAVYPAAKTVDSIVMVLNYCNSRKLDPFKRPVHIVPMWDSQRGAMVETVWPGISELRTTASRTNGYAGIDGAEFGDEIETEFEGRVKENGNWVDKKMTVTHPIWCRMTVYRVVNGQRCAFVGPKVRWLETYATQGKSELPNNMWQSRPEGQLEKCAEAGALRRAFPEELGSDLTAEEMVGRTINDLAHEIPHVVADQTAPATAASRDTGPPRALPAAEPPAIEAEDVRDGDPPPREAKPEKEDPISSGPPRKGYGLHEPDPVSNPEKFIKEGKPKAADSGPKPHRIPGAGHTFESWAEKFSDLVKTSEDTATVYKWIDENTKDFTTAETKDPQTGPLKRLEQKKPSVYATVRKTIELTMQSLRAVQEKATEKAAKKPAPAKATASDMDDGPANDQLEQSLGASNPEDILKIIDQELAAVDDADNLQEVWDRVCDPLVNKLDFPPDKDEAQAIYNRHEKRLGGD